MADSRRVGFCYPHNTLYSIRRNTETDTDTAGDRVRRSYVRIRPVIYVKHRTLCALEQYILSSIDRLAHYSRIVPDHRF